MMSQASGRVMSRLVSPLLKLVPLMEPGLTLSILLQEPPYSSSTLTLSMKLLRAAFVAP